MKKIKNLVVILIVLVLSLFMSSCEEDIVSQVYKVDLQVESEGDFYIKHDYTGNPEASPTFLSEPPILYHNHFNNTIYLQGGDFYSIRIIPVDSIEFTYRVKQNGRLQDEITDVQERYFYEVFTID